MKSTRIIIQARTGSTRMPRKVALPFFAGKSIFELMTENLLKHFHYSEILLATTESRGDDELVLLAHSLGIEIFRGDEHDVLKRFVEAAKSTEAQYLVRVCADNPFLLADMIEPLLEELKTSGCDYVSYKDAAGTPVIKTHWGLFAEAVSLSALLRVQELTTDMQYREHVTNYIYQHPESFKVKLFDLPPVFRGRENYRFTLDTPVDFELLQTLYLNLNTSYGPGPYSAEQLFAELDKSGAHLVKTMRQQIARHAK
jgi:spore coat polysaccharide biosynthesis protein SpsF